MSAHLQQVVAALGEGHVGKIRRLFGEAGAAASAASDPTAVLYVALADALDDPQEVYRPALVAAAVMVEDARPGAVESVVAELRDSADESGHPLPAACARELAGAHLQAMLTAAAFSKQIGDTVPEAWTSG